MLKQSFSFHNSLAELRECTIGMADEKREDGKRERTSSLSSSASAQSLISLIPAEEIKKMIEEVKALDEETLKVQVFLLSSPLLWSLHSSFK